MNLDSVPIHLFIHYMDTFQTDPHKMGRKDKSKYALLGTSGRRTLAANGGAQTLHQHLAAAVRHRDVGQSLGQHLGAQLCVGQRVKIVHIGHCFLGFHTHFS